MRKTTIITDPIHQVMNFGSDPTLRKCLRDIIDTRTFQRLRRITQLGLASYVFPGATHTRFSHSLGVAYLARQVLAHLREWAATSDDRHEIDTVFKQVVLAALLHDVGHGPFSHCFEQLFKDQKWTPPLHEDWTAHFISHEDSEIHERLKDNGIDVAAIASIFTRATSPGMPRPFRQIISSQLDVDRMDYLVRDSHFAGVEIGRFDFHYLIHSVVIVCHDRNGTRTLGITPKGVKTYEAFLLARQLMNRTVYYHHNVKVLEFMMEHFLRLVIQHMDEIKSIPSIAPFLPPYLARLEAAAQREINKAVLMVGGHRDFVHLTEDAIWSLIAAVVDGEAGPELRDLAGNLLKRKILRHFTVKAGNTQLLRERLVQDGLVAERDFHLLDAKTTMYKRNGDEHVFVVNWDGDIAEVPAHSDTISAFRDRPEAESLLIVIDASKERAIRKLGEEGQFIIVR